jgi:hypothetical protein
MSGFSIWEEEARHELAQAHYHLSLADRLLSGSSTWDDDNHHFQDMDVDRHRSLIDPNSWAAFARHSRDAYRYAVGSLALYLQMDPTGGAAACAERLLRRWQEDHACVPRGVSDILPREVERLELLVPALEQFGGDREALASRMLSLDSTPADVTNKMGDPAIRFSWQKMFVEDVTELIERGAVGVVLPNQGKDITEATIVRWFKTAGEEIDSGEVLAEISTSKGTAQIRSPAAGHLAVIFVDEGETPLGEVVAIIYPH